MHPNVPRSIFKFKFIFIFVQVQLSPFPHHHFPLPHPTPPLALNPILFWPCPWVPLYMFLHDPPPSFPHYLPPLSPLVTVCSLFQCLWLYFACLFVLLIRFHLYVRSYICLSLPSFFHLAQCSSVPPCCPKEQELLLFFCCVVFNRVNEPQIF